MPIALTHFASSAGDHNDRAMRASPHLTAVLAERLSTSATVIGRPHRVQPSRWDVGLQRAMPELGAIASRLEESMRAGETPVTAISRCAVALATLPVVAKHRPDAVVVWFDAHADLNSPSNTSTGYLGGLALAGPLGLWDSGLGAGLEYAVLVGARDLDDPERDLIDAGRVGLVPVGADMAADLRRAIAGRPVYVHIDCDVLDPGIVPTDYLVPGGMTLAQLTACAEVLAESEVVGLEVGELDAGEHEGDEPPDAAARRIVEALEPIIRVVASQS